MYQHRRRPSNEWDALKSMLIYDLDDSNKGASDVSTYEQGDAGPFYSISFTLFLINTDESTFNCQMRAKASAVIPVAFVYTENCRCYYFGLLSLISYLAKCLSESVNCILNFRFSYNLVPSLIITRLSRQLE